MSENDYYVVAAALTLGPGLLAAVLIGGFKDGRRGTLETPALMIGGLAVLVGAAELVRFVLYG